MNDTILKMQGISKFYGGIKALEKVDFELYRGEILCLLGENGAGKSTLMKILSGVIEPSEGEIFLEDKKINIKNPNIAHHLGISTVHQELVQFADMTIMENIYMGRYPKKGGLVDFKTLKEKTLALMDSLDIHFNPFSYIRDLSVAQRQMVEIMKAVSWNADLVIMDEPTTPLPNNEKEGLFQIIGRLKEMGKSIIYITHILEEVFRVCGSASIMRNGKLVGSYDIGELTKAKITQLMTGNTDSRIKDSKDYHYADYNAVPVLELKGVSRGNVVRDVSMKVHKGEVVGLAGLVGSKRTETINLVYGIDRKTGGEILVNGKAVDIRSPQQAIAHRIGYIPEDRKNLGLILDQEIYKNATAVQVSRFSRHGFLDRNQEIHFAEDGVSKLGIKISSVAQKVKELSGGNQQKVVVSKWLGQDMDLIIYDEPTKGIDIAAKEDIFRTIQDFSSQGIGVIFISSDLEEVIRVSDRIIVIRDGMAVCEMENRDLTVQDIMNKIFNV